MKFQHIPIAKAQMLIRRPVAEVSRPLSIRLSRRNSGSPGAVRLEAGKQVHWNWEMYGVSSEVKVKEIERNKRILMVWSGDPGSTTVEWLFTWRPDKTTFVTISNSGFTGNGDEVVS